MTIMFEKLINEFVGCEVVKEHRFHPVRRWCIDYAIPSKKIAIEIEGGVWTKGRHTRGSGFVKDMEKYNALAVDGWRLLRFTPTEKNKHDTLLTIKKTYDYEPESKD